MLAEIRRITKTASLRIVLVVAAVVMAASLAPYVYEFWQGPRVMAVEFDGSGWASAVLEGNEIVVPRLLQIAPSAPPPRNPYRLLLWSSGMCWSSEVTAVAPTGWRASLSLRQAREFEDLYCAALRRHLNDRSRLFNCAWVRNEGGRGSLECD